MIAKVILLLKMKKNNLTNEKNEGRIENEYNKISNNSKNYILKSSPFYLYQLLN